MRTKLDALLAHNREARERAGRALVPGLDTDDARVVIGIDPGFSGALAVMTVGGTVVATTVMPAIKAKRSEIDVPAILSFLDQVRAERVVQLVVLELVGPRPTDSRAGAFHFGTNYGEVRGVVKTRGFPLELVTPQRWQKALGLTAAKKGQPKPSIAYVRRRFPGVSLRRTDHCKTDHDGLSDAICLAEWGRRLLKGEP